MEGSVLIIRPVEAGQKDGRAEVSPYLVAQGGGLILLFWWLLLPWIIKTGSGSLCVVALSCATYIEFFAKGCRVTGHP